MLVFLPVFLLVYHLLPARFKNYFILFSSILFYAWGAPLFVFLVLFSLIINFYLVRQLELKKQHKKLYLILSVSINLGLLGYFKYANFFVENLNELLVVFGSSNIQWTKVALPIGISFFTFQSLTYTVDVYRGVHKSLDKLSDYLLYILMFPQLIAGPIVRFNTIADDIVERRYRETANDKLLGFYRFTLGLAKKVLIANVLGEQVDVIMQLPVQELNTSVAWIGIVAYSFQIYFDFAGYSDMAIGLGRMIGFKFPENFNNPYISGSITEFWRRWHITLGAWMKDYLYIPLGGNRVSSKERLYFNLGLVFLLSGLWHGASWNFVLWGAWHGLYLILDRIFLLKLLGKLGKLPSMLLTYLVVLIGWVFFRIENFEDSMDYLKVMFSFQTSDFTLSGDQEFMSTLILATLFSFITAPGFGKRVERYFYNDFGQNKKHTLFISLSLLFYLVCVAYITASGFNPFIYFRF